MNTEIEAAVIAGMLFSSENAKEAIRQLSRYRFIDPENQSIYDVISEQLEVGSKVNPLLAKAKCGTAVTDETWLLVDQFDGASDSFADYVGILNEAGLRESLRTGLRSALSQIDEVSPVEILTSTKAYFASVEGGVTKSKTSHNISSMKEKFLNDLTAAVSSETEITGYSTGIDALDAVTSGLFPGDLVVIAGRPAMGKTTLAMNIAEAGLKVGKRVKVFSFEMPSEQIYRRIVASVGTIHMGHLKNGRLTELEAARLSTTVEATDSFDLLVDDSSGITMPELRRRVLQDHDEQPIDLMVIDYLQLMKVMGGSDNKASQIGDITSALKGLAKDMGCPIILLSQLNRSLEQRPNKRPMMSDLRESGAIEQDADIIMFVYRDEVYNPNSPDKGIAEIIIGKQRSGPTCVVNTSFEGQYSRFSNLPGGESNIISNEI